MKVKVLAIKNNTNKQHVVNALLKNISPTKKTQTQTNTQDTIIIYANLRIAMKYLNLTEKNTLNFHQDHLNDRLEEAAAIGNLKVAKHIRTLISITNQILIHRQIGYFVNITKQSKISQLAIPTDPELDLNRIPKEYPKEKS